MKKPSGVDVRDSPPTIAVLDCRLLFNGGTLSSDAVRHIWAETLMAFERAAHKQGLKSTWMGELKCMQPKRLQAMLDRLKLKVDPPPAAALAPHPETETP